MISIIRGFFLVFISLFFFTDFDSEIKGRKSKYESSNQDSVLSWSICSSPTSSRLHKIKMFSSSNGIIAGRTLLELINGEWIAQNPSPPMLISDFFAVDNKNIWVTFNTNTNDSKLYKLEGKNWKELYNPLANTIETAGFLNGKVEWLGGDRELVHNSKTNWKFITYPQGAADIVSLYSFDNNKIWINTSNLKLLFYDGQKWYSFLSDKKVNFISFDSPLHGFILSGNKIYEYIGKVFRPHSQSDLLNQVSKLSFLADGEIWGIGLNGLVIHYINGKWKKISVPTVEDLFDIQMLSPEEGWIVGNNGTILHYSFRNESFSQTGTFGFNQMKIVSTSKNIQDEYGVAIGDVNGDGLKDIYTVCLYEPNRLYINNSFINNERKVTSIKFNEEASSRNANGIAKISDIINFLSIDQGVGLADIDNNGTQDLYLCNLISTNKILLNDGKGYFRDVSGEPDRATGYRERSNSVVFGDVDNDGDLDMFVANEESSNRLYLNDGGGYFTDVTGSAGLTTIGGGMCAAFADVDGDGKLDLYVTNWSMPNLLYKNVSTKKDGVRFIDVTNSAGVAGDPYSKSNAVCFADIDNDGDLDLFVTNRKNTNRLYLNEGNDRFKDVTAQYLGLDSMLSNGAVFGDFDQDGFQDLYVSNVGENVFYKNLNGKKFIQATKEFGLQMDGYCTGSACGDIDNDGDLDIYAANYINGNSVLFINNVKNKSFIKFNIEGTKSNRDAIGTIIQLYQNGHGGDKSYLIGYREINSGSGYSSCNSKEVHFGISSPGNYDAVIKFPSSGTKKTFRNLRSGKTYYVREEDGIKGDITLASKDILRYLYNRDVHFEALKFLFVLILLLISIFWGKRRYKWKKGRQFLYHFTVFSVYWLLIYLFIYDNFILSTIIPFSFVLVSLSILHLIYEQVILVRINKMEKQAIRDRLARDLHDDLASTIGSSLIYTEALRWSLKSIPDENKILLDKVDSLLVEASNSIIDIVWTVSPSHDKLDDLLIRLKGLLTDNCRAKNIEHEIYINLDGSDFRISQDIRRNIYLIFKEIINNIMKHSSAKKVTFQADFIENYLHIKLTDDGKGFAMRNPGFVKNPADIIDDKHGNGISNIIKRAEEINAKLGIKSVIGNGTEIELTIKMT